MSRFEFLQQTLADLVDELDHADRLSAEQAERIDALEAENRRLREVLTFARRFVDTDRDDVLEAIDRTLQVDLRAVCSRPAQLASPDG